MTALDEPRLRRLNINLLYALYAVLRLPSLTQAARSMGLSQPAMSMALRRLRDHFGDEIVTYGDGGGPTALGQALYPRVRQLLQDVDETLNLRLDFDPATAKRSIAITAPEAIEIMFLSRVVPRILNEAPGLDIRLVPFAYGPEAGSLDKTVDIAIVPDHLADPSQPSTPLFRHGLSVLIANDRVTPGQQSMTAQQYAAGRHAALFDRVESALFGPSMQEDIVRQRNIVVRTGLYSMLPTLAVGTDLIVTTSNWFAQHHASVLPLTVLPAPIANRESTLVAQWQRHRDSEPLIRWIVAKLFEAITWGRTFASA